MISTFLNNELKDHTCVVFFYLIITNAPIIITTHLVLTTIHAKDSINALYRLLDLGVSIEELRQTVVGIVGQVLIQARTKQDERCALYEILSDAYLSEAIAAIMRKEIYELPRMVTIAGQKEVLEGQPNECKLVY